MFSARANIPIQLSSSKFQIAGFARVSGYRFQVSFGIWNLEFVWDLEFEILNFSRSAGCCPRSAVFGLLVNG